MKSERKIENWNFTLASVRFNASFIFCPLITVLRQKNIIFSVPMLVWTHSICRLYHAYTGIGPSSLSSLFFSPVPTPTRGHLIAVTSPEFKKDIHPKPTRNLARLQQWFDLEPWLLTSDSSKVSSNAFPVLHLAIRNGIWHTIYKTKI